MLTNCPGRYFPNSFSIMSISSYFPGVVAATDVAQTPKAVTVNENGNVSMECSSTVTSPAFQWYKQYGSGSIGFLLLGKTDVNMTDRIRALTERKQKNCTVTIENLRVSDTATYFCAEDTVLHVIKHSIKCTVYYICIVFTEPEIGTSLTEVWMSILIDQKCETLDQRPIARRCCVHLAASCCPQITLAINF
uniref:Ig-like domain-containing protein n=1 Tax=Callorhinchus milii TaxID=7868 RepID=A0A4W3J271_CALMI